MEINYTNLGEILISKIPELKSMYVNELDDDEKKMQHNVFGDIFNPFLINLIDNIDDNEQCIKRCFDLIEEMCSSKDIHVQEVAVFTILERLGDEEKYILKTKKYMGKETLKALKEVQVFWGRKL